MIAQPATKTPATRPRPVCPAGLAVCLLLALLALYPAFALGQSAPPDTPAPAQTQTTPAATDTPPSPPALDIEREKRELNAMLHAAVVILVGFFLAVALFTLIRVARRYHWWVFGSRRRSRTPYIDIWQQHRLTDQHHAQTDEDT